MADFAYYATMDESLDMLEDVLALGGFKLIHNDARFTSTDPEYFDVLTEEHRERFRRRPQLCIAGPFTASPPHIEKTSRGVNELILWKGGPIIGGELSELCVLHGVPIISFGRVWYQPHYYHPVTRAASKPSPELKAAYQAIVKRMKRRMKELRLSLRWWIAPEAYRLLREGKVFIEQASAEELARLGLPPCPPIDRPPIIDPAHPTPLDPIH